MRTRTLLSLTLLGLLLWASYTQADDTDAETDQETEAKQKEETAEEETLTDDSEDKDEEEEQAPQKEKTTEIEEEKDVLVLHINNFARALSEFEYLLVEFYAPWCGHCKQLEPVYAEAAGKLRTELPSVRLAKVDAIEEKELAEEFDIGGFPTLKLFTKGERKETVDFSGKRTVVGIQQWMKRRISPPAAVLDSVDSVAQFIDSQNITVVGFFEDLESEAVKVLKEIAYELTDTEFGLSASPEVFKKYEAKANSVVLFKKVADKVFTSGITTHCLLFINSSVETHMTLIDESRAVAKKFKGKMLFVSIDVTEPLSHVLNYFGVSDKDVPTVRVVSMVSGKKFAIDSDALTVKSLEELCQGVLDETAKPYYRSEDVPEDWDKGPVKVLVGKNFDSVAMDPTKNVFVEFYAPWCGHCKQLTPIWDQLGEKYADKEDIIIAKMDATANEVESVNVKSFPTLKYFPAGEDKKVIDYTGARDLETMSKFLDNGGVLPPEESDDEDGEDEVEDDDSEEKKEESGDDSKEADEATKEPPKDEL
ncbi:protein disulfide-isomerase A2 [Xyrichtys novacula]|uniref:protein disulfide-isomerase n=1 Tax=Xyrichtys novacula TaxID=13765 RepID=A0AAV1EV43_XYRNO|nr:protein disulfide-isomerase A2 [Xyrichtys novacula]